MARKKLKKPIKIILIALASIILVALIYVAYVFGSYSRIEDNLVLTPTTVGAPNNSSVKCQEEYSILSYNIGFGAYTSDYSFFMDGGKSSWAVSEEGLKENLSTIANNIKGMNPDFVVLQEVDIDGTRTYHVNEYEMFQDILGDNNYVFAQNYHSAFLMYPFTEPHGANNSGLVTSTEFSIDNAIRRQLPISTSVSKILDLDRCYSVTRIPTENGKFLCIYNVHLSAYGSDESVREGQTSMLFGDMEDDYKAGNYVICGGDYNHNLRIDADSNAPDWAQIFPREKLPSGFSMAFDTIDSPDIDHDSCRNADKPYDPNDAFTVMVDGFIVSDNISVTGYENVDWQYAYSDHDPVIMNFILE
ncbi:MAG: endonuclease/exonuclease/phosphatase family protein [Saccharofermentans sp.]|nr:endonuclease/exonuclease/phosphatase family protein [Saccharofermentans sp.]